MVGRLVPPDMRMSRGPLSLTERDLSWPGPRTMSPGGKELRGPWRKGSWAEVRDRGTTEACGMSRFLFGSKLPNSAQTEGRRTDGRKWRGKERKKGRRELRRKERGRRRKTGREDGGRNEMPFCVVGLWDPHGTSVRSVLGFLFQRQGNGAQAFCTGSK